MRAITRTAVAGGALAGGVAIVRYALHRRPDDETGGPARWHSVTVFRPLDEVRQNLPEGLTGRGGAWEVQLRAAPGGRGTELHARAGDPAVPDGEVRRVLRESRSILETGEVLQPGGPTTEPTVLNKPLRAVTKRGRTGGLL
jgi:hypothetical protein